MAEKKKSGALTTPQPVSASLAEFLGKKEATRAEVTKEIWAYIKANNLQDPKNRQTIVPDAKLGTIIGNDPINMMKMTGAVSKHFVKKSA